MFPYKLAVILSSSLIVSACSDSSSSTTPTPPVNTGIGDLTLAFYNNLTTATTASNIIVDFALGTAAPLTTNAHYDNNHAQHNLHTITTEGTSTIRLNVTKSIDASSLAATDTSIESGQHYTVVALGDTNTGTDVVSFKQDRTAPAAGKSNIRFVHALAGLNVTTIDVKLDTATIVDDLDFKGASSYQLITPAASAGENVSFELVVDGSSYVGQCGIRADTNYEAVIAYSDFNLTTPTVFCHPQ